MKARSKVDVITNSSSEVFILNCSLDKVVNELGDIADGYRDPEIIKDKNSKVIQKLIEYGYVVDLDDIDSVCRYYVDQIYKKNISKDISDKWFDYLEENGYKVDREKNIFPLYSPYIYPEGFVSDFLETVNLPEIPKEKLISSFIGKVGVISISENTIPLSCIDEVVERFNGVYYD